jgi:hypothetical protein
MKASV